MTFVTKGKANSWEIRESAQTPRGPRSRTLATFRRLDEDVLRRAVERASGPIDADQLRRDASRKGAPVARPAINCAARTLVAEAAKGRHLPHALAALVADAVGRPPDEPSAAARAAGEWLDASAEERGAALEDLLLLADALPPARAERAPYPRLRSRSG